MIVKLLCTGDWHLRGTNPRNRLGDYMADADAKLRELNALAQQHDVDAILAPGDIWDRPEVSISVLLHYAEILREFTVPIITTIGNHDIYGYNVESYERSSLRLLEMLTDSGLTTLGLCVLRDGDGCDDFSKTRITATPYSRMMDVDGHGYGERIERIPGKVHIHIAHGMLLDHEPPFDRYTLLQSCKTNADIVLAGHDHKGFGIFRRGDGKLFLNPGALMRMAASRTEMERTVQVALLTIDPDATRWNAELIPLQSAKPGEQVLDRLKIEADDQRQYAMEAFSTMIQTHTGGKALMDVNHIVEAIAKEQGCAPDVVKLALTLLDQQREEVR